jgi:hypothetical protein
MAEPIAYTAPKITSKLAHKLLWTYLAFHTRAPEFLTLLESSVPGWPSLAAQNTLAQEVLDCALVREFPPAQSTRLFLLKAIASSVEKAGGDEQLSDRVSFVILVLSAIDC